MDNHDKGCEFSLGIQQDSERQLLGLGEHGNASEGGEAHHISGVVKTTRITSGECDVQTKLTRMVLTLRNSCSTDTPLEQVQNLLIENDVFANVRDILNNLNTLTTHMYLEMDDRAMSFAVSSKFMYNDNQCAQKCD
ncbi:hypothetical protein Tco_1020657 [Tanacetum coccineum]